MMHVVIAVVITLLISVPASAVIAVNRREQKNRDITTLRELKPKLTTLNQIRYNFHILEHDELPEVRAVQKSHRKER